MLRYLIVRYLVTAFVVIIVVAMPYAYFGPLRPWIPKIVLWSALGSGIYLYFRLRSQHCLPAFDNLNISVVGWLAAMFCAIQVVAIILIW